MGNGSAQRPFEAKNDWGPLPIENVPRETVMAVFGTGN